MSKSSLNSLLKILFVVFLFAQGCKDKDGNDLKLKTIVHVTISGEVVGVDGKLVPNQPSYGVQLCLGDRRDGYYYNGRNFPFCKPVSLINGRFNTRESFFAYQIDDNRLWIPTLVITFPPRSFDHTQGTAIIAGHTQYYVGSTTSVNPSEKNEQFLKEIASSQQTADQREAPQLYYDAKTKFVVDSRLFE